MKNASLNGEIIPLTELNLSIQNRLFKYGDGFFETCKVNKGIIENWNLHLKRILKVFKVLELPNQNLSVLGVDILNLAEKEDFDWVNIYFWREADGLYEPKETTHTSVLIVPKQKSLDLSQIKNVGVCTTIVNHHSRYSFFKSDSLKYVLAGLEMTRNNWENIVITDSKENVSELLYSNIFWKKGNVYYTPSLKTGCIEGIGRQIFFDALKEEGSVCEIGFWNTRVLSEADEVFSANVAGVRKVLWKNNFL